MTDRPAFGPDRGSKTGTGHMAHDPEMLHPSADRVGIPSKLGRLLAQPRQPFKYHVEIEVQAFTRAHGKGMIHGALHQGIARGLAEWEVQDAPDR